MSSVRQFFDALLDVLLPPLCHICHSYIPNATELHICGACSEVLPTLDTPCCTICGIPFQGSGPDHLCGKCIKHTPFFDTARAAYLYEGAISELIHSLKYNHRTHLHHPLALLTLDIRNSIMECSPDLIVPVPLHISRLRSRGFNQSALIAAKISSDLHIPMIPDAMTRTRHTEPQIKLAAQQRITNVLDAFSVKRTAAVAGRSILLFDDVMTTGSTMNECAKALKKAGAARVTAITVARAAKHF